MSTDMAALLSLVLEPASTKITVANGQKATCRGTLRTVPARFGESGIKLNFLVVDESPVDLLIGHPTMEEL